VIVAAAALLHKAVLFQKKTRTKSCKIHYNISSCYCREEFIYHLNIERMMAFIYFKFINYLNSFSYSCSHEHAWLLYQTITIPLCQLSATSLHNDNSSRVIMCHSSQYNTWASCMALLAVIHSSVRCSVTQ